MHDDEVNQEGYEVGYGRPPLANRYRLGQSGNPKGRPKGSNNFAATFHELCQKKINVKDGGVIKSMTRIEAAITQLLNMAALGDIKAMRELTRLSQVFPYVANSGRTRRMMIEFVQGSLPADVRIIPPAD